MGMGNYIGLEIYPEICCEECNEVIHNHMDCPVCNKVTGTSLYGDVGYLEIGETIDCETCGTPFALRSKSGWFKHTKWEQLKEAVNEIKN